MSRKSIFVKSINNNYFSQKELLARTEEKEDDEDEDDEASEYEEYTGARLQFFFLLFIHS